MLRATQETKEGKFFFERISKLSKLSHSLVKVHHYRDIFLPCNGIRNPPTSSLSDRDTGQIRAAEVVSAIVFSGNAKYCEVFSQTILFVYLSRGQTSE